MEDFRIPSKEEKAEVRKIATEDKTNFAEAMRGWEDLRSLLSKQQDPTDREETRKRILESRKTLGITLSQAVRTWAAQGPELGVEKSKRKCRHPGCKKSTSAASFYWCKKHEPVDHGSVLDDASIYC